jgi:hypothetical protein
VRRPFDARPACVAPSAHPYAAKDPNAPPKHTSRSRYGRSGSPPERYPTLRFERRWQSCTATPRKGRSDRQHLGNLNVALLLSSAQDIDVDHVRPLDIDHIYGARSGAGCTYLATGGCITLRDGASPIGNMWLLTPGPTSADERDPELRPAERLLDETATRAFISGLERLLHPSLP